MPKQKRGTVAAMNTKADDPDYLWMEAVSQMMDGNAAPMAAALLDPTLATVSEDARQLLADLVQGKPIRKGGRPTERTGRVERSILHDVFTKWAAQEGIPLNERRSNHQPKIVACEAAAASRGMKDAGAINRILEDARKRGLSFEWWKKNGCPDFTKQAVFIYDDADIVKSP
jgi:hypothetical protein